MYIIEKAVKIFLKILNKKNNDIYVESEDLTSDSVDVLTCKHNFMPIDSTGNILACSKCGYIVSKKRLEKRKRSKNWKLL